MNGLANVVDHPLHQSRIVALGHDPDQRLGARFADDEPPPALELRLRRGDALPDAVGLERFAGAVEANVLQKLRQRLELAEQLARRPFRLDQRGEDLKPGDQLMALIALGLHGRGELRGNAVVATVMSNLGLERKLKESGLGLTRTRVGDRYVLEEMRKSGCNVGGEQSGHIILSDHSTTGDGLVAGLQVLAALVEAQAPASELLRQFEPVPQLLKNVRFNGGAEPLETDSVRKRIAAAEAELEGRGRLVIRKSGTEPLIRVMAEGDDPALVERLVDDICEAVQSAV